MPCTGSDPRSSNNADTDTIDDFACDVGESPCGMEDGIDDIDAD